MSISYERNYLKLLNTRFYIIETGLCSFPSEIVGKQYNYFDGSATTKFTDTEQLIEIKLQATNLVTSFSCEMSNGDFFIIR